MFRLARARPATCVRSWNGTFPARKSADASEISLDDSDERHVREMQAFGNHLCCDQDIDLTGAKTSQRFAIRFLSVMESGPCRRTVAFGKMCARSILLSPCRTA